MPISFTFCSVAGVCLQCNDPALTFSLLGERRPLRAALAKLEPAPAAEPAPLSKAPPAAKADKRARR